MFPVKALPNEPVPLVRLLRLQRRQRHAAAGHHRRTGGVDDISAHRADVQGRAQNIGRTVGIDHLLAREQLRHRNAQRSSQRLQQRDIGQAPGVLPLGHRLVCHPDFLRQLSLCQTPAFPQAFDGSACDIMIHFASLPFSPTISQDENAGNLRPVESSAKSRTCPTAGPAHVTLFSPFGAQSSSESPPCRRKRCGSRG